MRATFSSTIRITGFLLAIMLCVSTTNFAQSTMPSAPSIPPAQTDTAIIFQPSQPLIRNASEAAHDMPNSWGFDASFSDYGFGGGLFYSHTFSPDYTMGLSAEIGTAQGSREFDLIASDKINRVFVIPVMLNAEYRLFRFGLSDNLRPYITAGAGPVIAMTTPYETEFFSAFGSATSKIVPGGFIGLGAKFGSDPKSTFGASLRYFIVPLPSAIQSTASQSLTNLSGLFLTVAYGFNF